MRSHTPRRVGARRPRQLVLLAVVGLASLGAGVRPLGLGDVNEIRLSTHPTYTRVVVELSREVDYETHELGGPPRFYVDIPGIWVGKARLGPSAGPRDRPLVRVRSGQNTPHTTRVVIELDRADRRTRTFHLRDPFRIVTDVFTNAADVGSAPSHGSHASDGSRGRTAFDGRPVRRVVIDPGHGGKDPGTASRHTREKDVVLRVAREVGARLKRAGLEVHLTRNRDEFLTLEERTERANRWQADLFVSIHANASPNRKTRGIETYLLDTRYDRQTARVAARENGTTVDELNEVQRILASLRLGYNERYASRLARSVHASLRDRLRRARPETPDLGVKRGPFLVLFMADMPAILLELGFLSNREDARWLASKEYVRQAAEGIASGILTYRDEHARRLLAGF